MTELHAKIRLYRPNASQYATYAPRSSSSRYFYLKVRAIFSTRGLWMVCTPSITTGSHSGKVLKLGLFPVPLIFVPHVVTGKECSGILFPLDYTLLDRCNPIKSNFGNSSARNQGSYTQLTLSTRSKISVPKLYCSQHRHALSRIFFLFLAAARE